MIDCRCAKLNDLANLNRTDTHKCDSEGTDQRAPRRDDAAFKEEAAAVQLRHAKPVALGKHGPAGTHPVPYRGG